MTEEISSDWRTESERESDILQAKALRDPSHLGGLRFEAYLPPDLAVWVLDFVERGVFTDPSEAVFVILSEHKDLEPHTDLRQENLRRSLEAAANDPHPSIPGEEVMALLKDRLSKERPLPARWQKRKSD